MPQRIGIELSPTACRIVQVDVRWPLGADRRETVVRSYEQLPRFGPATNARLESLRKRSVAVVAWGLGGDCRQAVVSKGWYGRQRREAVAVVRQAGIETRRMAVDIAPVPTAENGPAVMVALANAQDVLTTLRPLENAGVRVRSIVTPALALLSLARLRPAQGGDLGDVYVALEETATALALVQDNALVATRELPWGFENERGELRQRDEIAARLANEIAQFLDAWRARPSTIGQVCVCGGLPELRSMTVPLMERLDIEVEPLDSLFAIDDSRLPEPDDQFLDRAAELRLAWAAAADWYAPINLLRERRRQAAKTTLTQAAVLAGVATGVCVGWQIQRWWMRPQPEPVAAPAASARPVRPAPVSPPVSSASSPTAAASEERPVAAVASVSEAPVAARITPSTRVRGGDERALPFDALLGTILYGPDRKLAIVDGRIVEVGDFVHGALVTEITPTTVLLRDMRGQLHQLTFVERFR